MLCVKGVEQHVHLTGAVVFDWREPLHPTGMVHISPNTLLVCQLSFWITNTENSVELLQSLIF